MIQRQYSCVCVQAMEVHVQYLLQEGSMLLPPTDTPLTGIEFTRRLPCGETERARKVYIMTSSCPEEPILCRPCECSLLLGDCVKDFEDKVRTNFH